MVKANKRKYNAIIIVLIIVICSTAIYIISDKIEFFNKPSKPVTEQYTPSKELLDPTTIKVKELIQQLDEPMISKYIEKLTSFGPHPTARRMAYKISNLPIIGKFFDLPIEKVAKYIYNEFESYGLKVRFQYWEEKPTLKNLFKPYWNNGWNLGNNIEATLPGSNKSCDEIYVFCAHYDTTRFSPGANDDSSGVAGLLAAAKLMSKYSFDHTIRFVAYSGEERGTLGSIYYAEETAKNNDNILATIESEVIGTIERDYRSREVLIVEDTKSLWIINYIKNVNRRYSEFLNLSILNEEITEDNLIKENYKGYASDYTNFIKKGYDAAVFTSSSFPQNMHTPSDTIENMDVSSATNISKLMLATLAELAWDVEYK